MNHRSPAFPAPGRRIAVVGTSGCGKSFVARKLAKSLGIPYICNDTLIWNPHWTPATERQRHERFVEVMKADAFTFDGNFGSLRHPEDRLVLERIDTLIWLDLSRWSAHRQLLFRTIRRAWTKEELWHGNRESWRLSFASRDSILWWAIKTHALRKRQYTAMFADPTLERLIRIRLRNRRQVDAFLRSVQST